MSRFRLSGLRPSTASRFSPIAALVASTLLATTASAQISGSVPEPLTRIVWQDYETKSLRWGELALAGDEFALRTHPNVAGFPKLDAERQELVQMERIGRILLVGVRDDAGGDFSSGWVGVDLGVGGGSASLREAAPPRTLAASLSESHGNPAHLYVYDGMFYLANDSLNGFTRLDPRLLSERPDEYRGSFHRGGGGHITIAAVENKIAYSTWIPGDGPQKGRIDVTDLSKPFDRSVAYSFFLPSGGLHGATANSGKVFFAPADGIYWTEADPGLKLTGDKAKTRHLSLGTDSKTQRPLRTGAFADHENWTLFTTGRGEDSALCLVDASASEPAVVKVPIPTEEGLSLVTPETVAAENGKRYAFVFQDRQEGDVQEKLTVIELDPNGDRDFSDALAATTLDVGASRVSGHYGHHTVGFDDRGRFAFVANPGDGEIWLLSLADLKVAKRYQVGGMPTKIVAAGGEPTGR